MVFLKRLQLKQNQQYNNNPAFDRDCGEKRKHYFKIRKKLKKRKSKRDQLILKTEAKIYRKFIKHKNFLFCENIHQKLRLLKSKSPKDYWNIINISKKQKTNSIDISTFYEHFKELNEKRKDNTDSFNENDILLTNNSDLNSEFTMEELDDVVDRLKCKKACGVDNIINEFIKYSSHEMRSALVRLFNLILNSGIVPTEWCISLIQPLYKNKGSKLDANNYRVISLISCIGKVFTQLINRRLENFIHQNDILGQEQAGFRSFFSTADHIFVLNIIIDLYLNKIKKKSKRLYCAFIDYEKAFDLIDRTLLFTKLISYNINGKLTKVIFSIYQNVKACVKLDNVISKSFLCNIGVRQGDSLSPLLFSLFLNDLNTFISGKYNGLSDISLLFSECFNMNVNDC